MDKKGFKNWLMGEEKENIIKKCISNCGRVEKCEGDLDHHFDKDKLAKLLERLEYTKKDQQLQKKQKHKIRISGDVRNVTATLKGAVKLYSQFRGKITNINEKRTKKNKSSSRNRRVTKWPKWSQPLEEDILRLAKILTPFVQFLKPEIIDKITEDNRKHQGEWSRKLEECGVDPHIYLWDNSPCGFPGVRRYSGKERNNWTESRYSYPDCFCIDGNSFPKHLWAFVFTGCEFRNHGPQGYQLAHLFDHKTYNDRWQKEMEGWTKNSNPPKLFGLFTSPANTVYVPTDFLKPTDHNQRLRTLLQRKAYELYGGVCQMLLPPLKAKPCDDYSEWDIDIKKRFWALCRRYNSCRCFFRIS